MWAIRANAGVSGGYGEACAPYSLKVWWEGERGLLIRQSEIEKRQLFWGFSRILFFLFLRQDILYFFFHSF